LVRAGFRRLEDVRFRTRVFASEQGRERRNFQSVDAEMREAKTSRKPADSLTH
jgi:hypothetical protein